VAKASAISSAAGCISGQWKGAETFSGMARAPSSLAFSMALSTAALSPEMTTLPLLLSLATTQTPTSEPAAAAASARARSVLGPIREAMAPSPTGTARCMAWPRSFSSLAVSARVMAPAAARAEYSPRLWPATKAARSMPMPNSFSSTRLTARLTAIRAGWAFSVRVRSVSGTFLHQGEKLLAQGVVDFLEDFAGGGEGLGEVRAHADGLAALAGENEGDAHGSPLRI
jgi:hypothetical protein